MPKNPFVNCKSRKRRKPRVVVNVVPRGERPFCPHTMVRYDNTLIEYKTVWVCKMCMGMVLKKEALQPHIDECKKKFVKEPAETPLEDTEYICDVCNKVFSRKVALKNHQETHKEKEPSDLESDEEEKLDVEPSPPEAEDQTIGDTNSPSECIVIDDDDDDDVDDIDDNV